MTIDYCLIEDIGITRKTGGQVAEYLETLHFSS